MGEGLPKWYDFELLYFGNQAGNLQSKTNEFDYIYL